MGWFKHRHWWIKDDYHPIKNKEGGNERMLVIEQCRCGAVRTIEYGPGADPIVRVVEAQEQA